MREKARRLTRALNQIDIVYLANEKQTPISDGEYCFMYALDDGQPHSQMEISREWLIPKTTINSVAKRFEQQGYITLTRVPGTRREMMITLTDSGKEYVARHLAFMYHAEDEALKRTLEQYGEDFIAVLEAYGQNLKQTFVEWEETQ